MKSIERKIPLVIDLFFCVIFMPLLVLLGPAHGWIQTAPAYFCIATAYLYLCYFAMRRARVPQMVIAGRYWLLGATIGGAVLLTFLLTLYPLPQLDFVTPTLSRYHTQLRDREVTVTTWLMFSLVMAYSLTTALVTELYSQLLEKKRVEAQRDKAELAMFKAQISPHFLFNTLNSLYSLVIGTSQKAEDAFIKFTDILKYTYVTIEREAVPLRDEVNYIRNYIDLQAIRLNSRTRVTWAMDVDDDSSEIPPMLMLTFVENAFKYGSSASADCEIAITLSLREGVLRFSTRNGIMKHADDFRTELPKGMENCRARLRGLYPGRHTLSASETDGTYAVDLNINLDRNGNQRQNQ
ncbi:MAG: histidine kinase [Muribaculaceae bacterium]|nr:histidine kinase [Muribaculaceae bacterium]